MATRYFNQVDKSGDSQSSRFDSDSFYTSSDLDVSNEGIDGESPGKTIS